MQRSVLITLAILFAGALLMGCDETGSTSSSSATPVPHLTATPRPTSTPDPSVSPPYAEIEKALLGREDERSKVVGTQLINWHGWIVDKYEHWDPPAVWVHIRDPFAEELLPAVSAVELYRAEASPTARAAQAKLEERERSITVLFEQLAPEQIDSLPTGSEVRFEGTIVETREGSNLVVRAVRFEILTSSTQPTPGFKDVDGLIITLERGICFGLCPDYSLTITGDGTVKYEGHRYVRVCGTQSGSISKEAVAELAALFEKADFFVLRNYEEAYWTDSPYYSVSLAIDGKSKEVLHYAGDVTSPTRLGILENRIDEITESEKWTGVGSDELYSENCELIEPPP